MLLSLETPVLFQICSANTQLSHICEDEYFWELKVEELHLNILKPTNRSWKQHYMILTSSKKVTVIYCEFLRDIIIKYTDTINQVLNKANDILHWNPFADSQSNPLSNIRRISFKDKNGNPVISVVISVVIPILNQGINGSITYQGVDPNQYIGDNLFLINSIEYIPNAFQCNMMRAFG